MSFIDCILGVMEKIVDAIFNMAEILRNIATGIIALLIMAFLLVTVPVWIVPYLVWKNRKEDRDDDTDDDLDKSDPNEPLFRYSWETETEFIDRVNNKLDEGKLTLNAARKSFGFPPINN